MLKLTLRSLWSHKARLALTVIAVTIGVTFVSMAFILADSLTKTFDSLSDQISGPIDLQVRDADFDPQELDVKPISISLVDEIAAVPGVDQVTPAITTVVFPIDEENEVIADDFGPPTLGFAYVGPDSVTAFELLEGGSPQSGEVLVDIETADDFDLAIGDTLPVSGLIGERQEYEIVGIVRFGEDNGAGARYFLFELGDIQAIQGYESGQIQTVDVSIDDGSDPEIVKQAVQQATGPQFSVVTSEEVAEEFADSFAEFLNVFRGVLVGFSLIALLVSIFVIANTFAIVLGQRLRELGLLRAIGAGTGQVTLSVMVEALLVGLVASLVGLALGWFLAFLAAGFIGGSGSENVSIIIEPRTVAIALAVGVGVTLVSALLPALRAGRIPPIAALRSGSVLRSERSLVQTIIGSVLGIIGLGLVALGLIDQPDDTLALIALLAGGALLVVIAVALLSSIVAKPVVDVIASRPAAYVTAILGGLLVVAALVLAGQSVADVLDGDGLSAIRDQFGDDPPDDAILKAILIGQSLFGIVLMAGTGFVLAQPALAFTSKNPKYNTWYWRLGRIALVIVLAVVFINGLFMTFAAFGLAIPLLIGAAILILAGRSGLGIPGRIAKRNASTNQRRTATTAASLMIGLALIATTVVVAESLKASFTDTLGKSVSADYFVYDQGFFGFTPTTADELEALPEVEQIGRYRTTQISLVSEDDRTVNVWATVPEGLTGLLDIGLIEGSFEGLDDGGIIVHKDPAGDLDLQPGDPLTVSFPETGNIVELTVIGIHEDAALLENYIVGLDTYNENVVPTRLRDSFVAMTVTTPDIETSRPALEGVTEEYPQVTLENRDEFQDSQEGFLNQALTIVNVFLAISIVVALVGIANTMALGVFERTRELGLLRAVGMDKFQIRQMIRWESVAIAVFGAVLGIAMGLLFGYTIVSVLPDSVLTKWAFPWQNLIALLAVAAIAGMIAAYFPSRRAGNLAVLDAIAEE